MCTVIDSHPSIFFTDVMYSSKGKLIEKSIKIVLLNIITK